MKSFLEHSDACNYAKMNPGLVVVRNGQDWFVGEVADISKLTKATHAKTEWSTPQNSEMQINNESMLRDASDHEDLSGKRFEDLLRDAPYNEDPIAKRRRQIDNEYILLGEAWYSEAPSDDMYEYENNLLRDDYFDIADPDPWNDSVEDGWFYED